MATPLVSGAAALLFSARPDASYLEVRNALLSSVDVVPALTGQVASNGRLNVANAMAALLGLPTPYMAPPDCEPAFSCPLPPRLACMSLGARCTLRGS